MKTESEGWIKEKLHVQVNTGSKDHKTEMEKKFEKSTSEIQENFSKLSCVFEIISGQSHL